MPYEEHSLFESPESPDAYIWRYMSFTKLFAFLNDGALYFTRADKLAEIDPFEGHLTHVNAASLDIRWDMAPPEFWAERGFHTEEKFNSYVQGIKMIRNTYKTMREIHFINCWHLGEDESDAMWKLYSGADEGVCIQSTFGNLIASLTGTEERVYIGKVKYLDYKKDAIDESNVFAPFISKRRSFQHERELRAVVRRMGDTDHAYFNSDGSPATKENWHYTEFVNKYPDRHGLNIAVDVSKLVHAIYISPTSPVWFANLVHTMTEKLGYSFEITQSALADTPPP